MKILLRVYRTYLFHTQEYQQVMEILKVYFTPNSTDNTTTINRNLAIYGNTYLNNPLIEALNYQTIANHNKTQNLSKKKDRKKTYLLRLSQKKKSKFKEFFYKSKIFLFEQI